MRCSRQEWHNRSVFRTSGANLDKLAEEPGLGWPILGKHAAAKPRSHLGWPSGDSVVRHLPLVCVLVAIGLLTPWFLAAEEGGLFLDRYPVPESTIQAPFPPAAICLPKLAGRIVDYTNNHGVDRRFWSPSLGCWRDVYVYLPPCFDPKLRYPVAVYFHGVLQDEKSFVSLVAPALDAAIRSGSLPPMIVVAPDGSFTGEPNRYDPGSFYINGPRGRYQDWVLYDLWQFIEDKYPIRPENKAHIMVGVSMGGFGAFNIAIKEHERFGIAVGVLPALNVRWMGCDGCYFTDFSPENWCWRTRMDNPNEVIGRFGFILVRVRQFIHPAFGAGPEALALAAQENPIELLERHPLRSGDLDMWVGYAEEDEFNLDAQAESFIFAARQRGLDVSCYRVRRGRHSEATALVMLPDAVRWMRETMERHGVAGPVAP